MLCARRERELKSVAKKCSLLGASFVDYVIADVSKLEDCRSLLSLLVHLNPFIHPASVHPGC